METFLYRSTRNQLRNIMAISDFQFFKILSCDILTYFLKSDLDIFHSESWSFAWWWFKPYQCSIISNNKKVAFDLRWPQVRSFLWSDMSMHAPAHYKSVAEISAAIKMHLTGLSTSELCQIRLLLMTGTTLHQWPAERSSEVTWWRHLIDVCFCLYLLIE